jgi:uncharacterized double-CXXCG motif protein
MRKPVIYQLGASASNRASLDWDRRWRLPLIECSTCGETWGRTYWTYPCFVPPGPFADPWLLRDEYRKLSPSEFARFIERYRDALPQDGRYLGPGAGLGPLQGRVRGRVRYTGWIGLWIIVVRAWVDLRLREAGARLPRACPTALRESNPASGTAQGQELLELDLDFQVELCDEQALVSDYLACEVCGRHNGALPKVRIMKASSVPDDVDIFHGKEATMSIFCTERFKQAADAIGIDDIAYASVATV